MSDTAALSSNPEASNSSLQSSSESAAYSVQDEARRIFEDILLKDERLQLPDEVRSSASFVSFGDTASYRSPVLPCPLKMTESCSALWALLCTASNVIGKQRYGLEQTVKVNTDIATLFLMSTALCTVNGKTLQDPGLAKRYMRYDLGNSRQLYRRYATNVYPTKDGKWFHLHGSMDATPTLKMLGLPESEPEMDDDEAIGVYCNTVKQWNSQDIDTAADSTYQQAGTICNIPEEFEKSEQGKATAEDGLYVLQRMSVSESPPTPWPSTSAQSHMRPLEGIKILDLSRVIAAPTIAKLAALFGATVIRISCSTNPDMGPLLVEGNLGKRDVTLDLKSEPGKEVLRSLIKDCDVFLDGYRPGAMERLGFGPDAVRTIAEASGKGIVYVRENCYGWKGPWAHRSGWQQISDCVTGVSYLQGQFLGLDEPVVPLIPNSDYQTGIIGLVGIMAALLQREKQGGSYLLSVALNYYNTFLLSLGQQTQEVQAMLKEQHKDLKLRHFDDMTRLVGKTVMSLYKHAPRLFRPEYFQQIKARLGEDGETLRFVGPVANFEKTTLCYDIGPSFLGEDEPRWP